eukprot:COSAG01_NODE_426_length_17219_cov_9.275637_8_plen_114_part_00
MLQSLSESQSPSQDLHFLFVVQPDHRRRAVDAQVRSCPFYMQFPLTLCYALTNSKAQGQTLFKIAIDQRNDSFSHGHTYVAFGRARNRGSVCVLVMRGGPGVGQTCDLPRFAV